MIEIDAKGVIVSHDDRGNVYIELRGQITLVMTTAEASRLSERLLEESQDAEMEL